MMDKFQIEIFVKSSSSSSSSKNEIYTTIESFITLFVFNYLNCSKNIQIQFVKSDFLSRSKQKICICLNNTFDSIHQNESEKNFNSKFPIYEKENLFIFGICAISRALVLNSGNQRDELLGFKKSCLLAPAEKSIWTRLCEIDMIEAVREIIEYYSKAEDKEAIQNTEEILPDCFTIFEYHMAQPTRAHNFYKLLREKVQNHKKSVCCVNSNLPVEKINHNLDLLTLEHNFAEGYFFSLVDVILYPCISFLFISMNNEDKFSTSFPLIYKWLKRVEQFDENLKMNFHKILNTEFYKMKTEELNLNFIKCVTVINHSLYRTDVKQAQREKEFTNQSLIDACLERIYKLNLNIKSLNTRSEDLQFDWEKISYLARPELGDLPKERLTRKKHQLRNLIDAVIKISKENDVIVDFCSGTGHLGIILAELLPQCHIIFLENKSFSIMKTKKRIEKLNLKNCSFYQSNIDYFECKFNTGVSLHACGTATDIVLWKCIKYNANFICCPCCYGSISPMPHIRYPLSDKFKKKLNENDFLYIAHAADQSHDVKVKNCNLEKREQGEFCMDIIDTDRKSYAEENGYRVQLKKLYPEDCTPKNRLLIGVKV